MKLQQLKTGQYFLSLPMALVRAKGGNKGDVINAFINKEGEIVLKKRDYTFFNYITPEKF